MAFDAAAALSFSNTQWDSNILPSLIEYCKIPNQSPAYDPAWATNGLIEKAAKHLADWASAQTVPGLKLETVQLPGRTPLIFIEVAAADLMTGNANDTVLLYGHLDKQPPLTPSWNPGLGPYSPVIQDGKLYARGGADDGYAIYAAITAIAALKAQKVAHPRYVVLIEACEESGSPDLPFYVEHLQARIGVPSLIVCLDSGCGNYEQLWLTSSLRGLVAGVLNVKILTESVHSGAASGVVPSSFRIIRQLLSRIEDEATGNVLVPELHGPISESRHSQAKLAAEVLGNTIHNEFPFIHGAHPMAKNNAELLLNKTWRPTVSYTGVAGVPPLESAGNVLRTETSLMLSVRLPPNVKAEPAIAALKQTLEKDPPYGAKVSFTVQKGAAGWESPELAPWLSAAVDHASRTYWHKPACYIGEGGSIPFMGMLGARFPRAQFVITGVLGPKSNAHGPNEFLHLDMGRKVTAAVTYILAQHSTGKH